MCSGKVYSHKQDHSVIQTGRLVLLGQHSVGLWAGHVAHMAIEETSLLGLSSLLRFS
jgi:hypothetical protein